MTMRVPLIVITVRMQILMLVAAWALLLPGLSPAADAPPDITLVESPRQWLAQAHEQEEKKDFEAAAALYRRYLDLKPEDDEVRAFLARVLSWRGQYAEAEALYRDILTRHPIDLDVRLALARVISWQRRLEEARALYEAVLEDDPDNLEAVRGLADVLLWSGQRTEALRRYQALYARIQDPEVARRIDSLKAELDSLTPNQAQRAPVGVAQRTPVIPFRDYYKLGYSHFTYTNKVPQEHDGRIEVGKAIGAQTIVGRLDQMNRFGFNDTQLSTEVYSPLWRMAWGYVAGSTAFNPDFLPTWSAGGELFQGLGAIHRAISMFEPSIGVRHMAFRTAKVDILTPGLTVYLPYDLWITEKLFYVPDTGSITLASQLTWQPSERVQVFGSYGFGTAGERITATVDFTRVSSKIVQGGVTFPLARFLSAETSVYYEDRSILYVRRGGTFNLIFHW